MTKCMACKEVEKKKGGGRTPDVFGKVGEEIEKGTSRDTRRLSSDILCRVSRKRAIWLKKG